MKIRDLFEEIYSALLSNKARSFLTVLGIVIGIASVIAMVAIGQGAQGNIESSIQSIGSNLLIIMPGAQRGVGTQISSGRGSATTLTQDDADAVRKLDSVKQTAPEQSRRYQVTAKANNTNTQIIGTAPAYTEVRNIEIDQGIFITEQDLRSASKIAVLGPSTKNDLFGDNSEVIGQFIRINGINFKVIGVAKAKGGSGFSNSDDAVYIPLSSAQRYLAGDDYVTSVSIEASDQSSMSIAKQEITDLLLQRHKISDVAQADFNIMSQEDIIETASSVTSTFTMLLASIAGISLLVGGIGIMNMMLTTVTERTREIGLRKAIGAKKNDISRQFLMEAVALTFIGGVIGVLFGWLLSLAASKFASLPSAISVSSVFLAFGVSTFIGIVFGYYPARKASALNPIEALRYE
jgi:putative ABC transport system permease protein